MPRVHPDVRGLLRPTKDPPAARFSAMSLRGTRQDPLLRLPAEVREAVLALVPKDRLAFTAHGLAMRRWFRVNTREYASSPCAVDRDIFLPINSSLCSAATCDSGCPGRHSAFISEDCYGGRIFFSWLEIRNCGRWFTNYERDGEPIDALPLSIWQRRLDLCTARQSQHAPTSARSSGRLPSFAP